MRTITALAVLISCASCAPRYDHHTRMAVHETDTRECMYDAYRAGHWEDYAFLDACMMKKGYTVRDPNRASGWWPGIRETFIESDKQRGITPPPSSAH